MAVLIAMCMAAAGPGDDQQWPYGPQQGAGRQQQAGAGGPRAWFSVEFMRAELEADHAGGNSPLYDNSSDFKQGIDTFLHQTIPWFNMAYQLDVGATFYGKAGYAFLTLEQDIGGASVLGPPAAQEGGPADPFLTYGLGTSYYTALAQNIFLLVRTEWTKGEGEVDDYLVHDVVGDAEFEFDRIEAKAALGLVTDVAMPFLGIRYNWYKLDMDVIGLAGEILSVEYELEKPFGAFAGMRSMPSAPVYWSAEVGFSDSLSFELSFGLAF